MPKQRRKRGISVTPSKQSKHKKELEDDWHSGDTSEVMRDGIDDDKKKNNDDPAAKTQVLLSLGESTLAAATASEFSPTQGPTQAPTGNAAASSGTPSGSVDASGY